MLIEITNKCNEKCTHCMVNAFPNGSDMEESVFLKSVNFAVNNSHVISISGGDPFLHPEFFKFMRYLITKVNSAKHSVGIVIESNGWWITDGKIVERIKKLVSNKNIFGIQISTNKKYYPNYEFTMSHKDDYSKISDKVKLLSDWQGVDTHILYMGS